MGGRPAGQTTPPTPPPRTELAGNRTCTPRGKNRPSTALGSNPASRTTAGLFLTNFHLGNRFEAPHSQLVSGIVSQCVRGGGAREHVPTTTPEPAVAPPPSTSGSLPPPRAAGHLGCSHPAERPPTPATGHGHLGCSPTAERPPRPSGTSGASPFPPPRAPPPGRPRPRGRSQHGRSRRGPRALADQPPPSGWGRREPHGGPRWAAPPPPATPPPCPRARRPRTKPRARMGIPQLARRLPPGHPGPRPAQVHRPPSRLTCPALL